jgi:hypothetical protein
VLWVQDTDLAHAKRILDSIDKDAASLPETDNDNGGTL